MRRIFQVAATTLSALALIATAQAAHDRSPAADHTRSLARAGTAASLDRLFTLAQGKPVVAHIDAPVPEPPPAPAGPQTYTVQPGEGLTAIAAKLGMDWHRLCGANHIKDPNHIEPGTLIVPAAYDVVVNCADPAPPPPPEPAPRSAPAPGVSASASSYAGPNDPASNQALGQSMAAELYGWTGQQWGCLNTLWGVRESGWVINSTNPHSGAYGIPQALPGSKMASFGSDWRTNPKVQIAWGLNYIRTTYGTPCGAKAKSDSSGGY